MLKKFTQITVECPKTRCTDIDTGAYVEGYERDLRVMASYGRSLTSILRRIDKSKGAASERLEENMARWLKRTMRLLSRYPTRMKQCVK